MEKKSKRESNLVDSLTVTYLSKRMLRFDVEGKEKERDKKK